jgi:hypothetical protein
VASWIPLIRGLLPFAVQKYLPGAASPTADQKSYYGADLGHVSPARTETTATATVMNELGMEGRNAASFNRALFAYGAQALQQAVDEEGKRQMEYALKKGGEEFKALVQPSWT